MSEIRITIDEFQELVAKYAELLSVYKKIIAFEESERRRKILMTYKIKK